MKGKQGTCVVEVHPVKSVALASALEIAKASPGIQADKIIENARKFEDYLRGK